MDNQTKDELYMEKVFRSTSDGGSVVGYELWNEENDEAYLFSDEILCVTE